MVVCCLFRIFGKDRSRRIQKLTNRIYESFSLPLIFACGLLLKSILSFVSWIRVFLISWGVIDGIVSYKMYKEEKFFPYQFIRFGRIAANLSGVISPIIPFIWNISDGIYSLIIYSRAHPTEHLSRVGRVTNGIMHIAFS
ncbi:MAG: hypothetical protein RMJ18_00805 [Candidatus Aenigmarchaeota archaeon]|nr:hypothetical protein [Candidatus Aenigmarchaeota archaeon]MCX8190698.1 hypothetical protein [Candidatus Aenigmarchaeota archaeon]MDW8159947.1 hypothetical protein [Candidatus Aenigmarchaeota archaeon]